MPNSLLHAYQIHFTWSLIMTRHTQAFRIVNCLFVVSFTTRPAKKLQAPGLEGLGAEQFGRRLTPHWLIVESTRAGTQEEWVTPDAMSQRYSIQFSALSQYYGCSTARARMISERNSALNYTADLIYCFKSLRLLLTRLK